VKPGSVVYVGARVAHLFHSVEEDLRVLVFWAPPSGSRGGAAAPGDAAGH
jgi:mannose-6-phosphate isomerase-like protein (cupin superfamily)